MSNSNLREHPDFFSLQKSLSDIAPGLAGWSGTIFRAAPPKWATAKNMLSGLGSKRSGGRFNAAGSFAAIYASTTPELAMMESLAYQRRANLPAEYAMPLVFKAIQVRVERILDLRDGAMLARLGISTERLVAEQWWIARARSEESLTQAIGRAAYTLHIQGLIAPSAQSRE